MKPTHDSNTDSNINVIRLISKYSSILPFIVVLLSIFLQVSLIRTTGITADEPNYNLNSFFEARFLLGLGYVNLGLDVLHGYTFQWLGNATTCVFNLDNCKLILQQYENKSIFWENYGTFLIGIRYILIPISLIGQLAITFAAKLFFKNKSTFFYAILLINLYPMWLSHSSFNHSDFPALAGFSVLMFIISSIYHLSQFHTNLIVRVGVSPWILGLALMLIAGSRFPLVFFAILSIFISFVSVRQIIFKLVPAKKFFIPLLLFLILFAITNPRFIFELPNSLFSAIGISSKFGVPSESTIFNFSNTFLVSDTPSWYVIFNNFARIPVFFLALLAYVIIMFIKSRKNISQKLSFFLISIFMFTGLPILLSIVLNSNMYDTGRHFLFVHSAIIFFSIYAFLHLKVCINLNKMKLIFIFLMIPLFIDSLLLNNKLYVYRNEVVRIFGVNVMESDYWAANRNELDNFAGPYSNPILLENQWYQSNVRLFFSEFTFAKNEDIASKESKMSKRIFIYRSAVPMNFAKFELRHPSCRIQFTSSSRLISQNIIDGRIYLC